MADEKKTPVAGLIAVGAVVAFGGLLFFANFTGKSVAPDKRPASDDMFDTKPKKHKGKRGGAKGQGKPATAHQRTPESDLWHTHAVPKDRAAAPEGASNLVLVVLTAARKDHLTPYGAPAWQTPFLQEVASRGVRFADTIADAPFSRSSTPAMLTGLSSATLDMVEPGPQNSDKVLADSFTTLAEVLQGAGWTTMGATGNFNLNQDVGLAQGFDTYRDAQHHGFAPGQRTEAGELVELVGEWLDHRPHADRPLFMQLDFIDLHSPIRLVKAEVEGFNPAEPNAPYRASMRRVDDKLGDLWVMMNKMGYNRENTYLVVVADHGEGLKRPEAHGRMHGRLLYESSVAVPWIIDGPDVAANAVVGGLAAQVDLMPTLVDLMGLPVPEGLEGKSWAAQVRGEQPKTTRKVAFSNTWFTGANRGSVWTSERQCQLDFGSVDVEDSFVDACYDRRTDPDFTTPIEDPELMSKLKAWRKKVTPGITSLPDPALKEQGKAKEGPELKIEAPKRAKQE